MKGSTTFLLKQQWKKDCEKIDKNINEYNNKEKMKDRLDGVLQELDKLIKEETNKEVKQKFIDTKIMINFLTL